MVYDPRIRANIFAGESGGDYNALFGYQNRPDGRFSDINLTSMPIADVLSFTDPSGPYAQYVKDQVGRVATPVGAYQVVGSTLRDAVNALGIDPNTPFNQATQDRIGQWILDTQGTGAWAGYQPNAAPIQISTSGVNAMPMTPQQPQGLLGYLGIQKQDPTATDQTALPFYQRDRFKDTMGNLAVALNEMRLNPSQAVPQIIQSRQEGRQQTRMDNRTIEWLRGQPNGERFAQLAEAVGAGPALQMYQEAIKGPEQTALMQNYEYALRQGMSPEEARQWVSSGTNINMGAGETAWDKGIGQYGVDTYVATQSAANSAIETLGNLQQMEVLMNDPNFRSGTGADALSSAAKIVELLGGNPAEVSSMEAFRAQVSNSVLSKLGGSLGAGFSDGDRRFIETTVPNLTNSVEGNRLIISIARNMANRQIEIGQLADQYVAQNGRLDAGWNAFIRNWANQNPLFPVNPDGTLSEDAQSYLGGQ